MSHLSEVGKHESESLEVADKLARFSGQLMPHRVQFTLEDLVEGLGHGVLHRQLLAVEIRVEPFDFLGSMSVHVYFTVYTKPVLISYLEGE